MFLIFWYSWYSYHWPGTNLRNEVWKWSPFTNTSMFLCRTLCVIHSFVAVKQKARCQNRPPIDGTWTVKLNSIFYFFCFKFQSFKFSTLPRTNFRHELWNNLEKKIMRVWNLDPISLNIKYLPSFFFSFFLFLLLFAFHFKNFEPKASNNRTMRFLSR